MKYIFSLLLVFSLVALGAQDFSMTPLNPKEDDIVTIQYTKGDGPLKDHEPHAVVYKLSLGESPVAHEVFLKNGKGQFKVASGTQALLIKFANEDESVFDKNDEKGYVSPIYNKTKVVKGAHAALAAATSTHFRHVNLERDFDLAQSYLDKEILTYPELKNDLSIMGISAQIFKANKDDINVKMMLSKINEMRHANTIDEEILISLSNVAGSLGEKELRATILEDAVTKFPNGKSAVNKMFSGLRQLETVSEKVTSYSSIMKIIEGQDGNKGKVDGALRTIAMDYHKAKDYVNFEKYKGLISSPTTVASLNNSIAWEMSGESLEAEAINAELGAQLSKESLKLIEMETEKMTQKQDHYTSTRFKNNMAYNYAMYSDTYALLAHKLGQKEDALKYQTIAVEANKYADGDMNARYTLFKENVEGGQSVIPFLEEMIAEGQANVAMKDQYKRLFVKHISIEDAADKQLVLLEKEARQKHIKEIKEQLYKEAPKAFSLVNLDGESVSLESVKGKIVILDFWATWCGPCKASFPGMQKAVDKFADSDKVEFLFVDTWESGDNKEAAAKKFLDSKGYTFNVLMDNKNEMVSNFGVSGIPTKYILDQKGNIRFKSVGFDGNDSKLIDELSVVIDILLSEKDMTFVEP